MQHCLITSLLLSMNLFANKTDRCAVLATQCEKERNLFFLSREIRRDIGERLSHDRWHINNRKQEVRDR